MDINIGIALTEEQRSLFTKAIKAGVFKQLYKQKLLTDEQLDLLLKRNKKQ